MSSRTTTGGDLANFLINSMFTPNLREERSSRTLLAWKFPIDMVDTQDTIHIRAELPGVNKQDIKIDIYNNQLTISAEKKPSEFVSQQGLLLTNFAEIRYGTSSRTITLPICITKKETVVSSYQNGVLDLRINKHVEEENKFSVNLD